MSRKLNSLRPNGTLEAINVNMKTPHFQFTSASSYSSRLGSANVAPKVRRRVRISVRFIYVIYSLALRVPANVVFLVYIKWMNQEEFLQIVRTRVRKNVTPSEERSPVTRFKRAGPSDVTRSMRKLIFYFPQSLLDVRGHCLCASFPRLSLSSSLTVSLIC